MVNVTLDDCLSVPAEAAAPVMPPGIASVTFVSGWNPDDGVKVAVAPLTCQLPAIFGESIVMRILDRTRVETLIKAHQRERLFGLIGERRINVLELNLALDQTH